MSSCGFRPGGCSYPLCPQGVAMNHASVVKVAQSCPHCLQPEDGSPPGSSVHGILQARILEWVVIPFSRGSS